MEFTKVEGIGHDYLTGTITDKKNEKETLEKYKAAKAAESVFNIKFEAIDSARGLAYVEDNGVRVCIPISSLSGSSESDGLGPTALVRVPYSVRVDEIDEVAYTVYCKAQDAKADARVAYRDAIEKALSKGEQFCVRARVVHINIVGRRLFVDIAGVGLQGVIYQPDWSKTYTSSFKNIVSVGDIVPVVITGKAKVKNSYVYVCSRKLAILDDCWAGIETRYPVGSLVTIKCIQRRERSFFGNIEGLKDIEVFCEYPTQPIDSRNNPLVIVEGEYYMGKIYRVSEEKKSLKARILYKIKER